MKRVKWFLASLSFSLTIFTPLLISQASAAVVNYLSCNRRIVLDNNIVELADVADKCDLGLDKQVSVNGGAFVDADTSPDAAIAQIGDTVTWKITVTNESTNNLVPFGYAYILDVIPSGFTFNSYTASAGTYGIFPSAPSNYWSLPLLNSDSNTNLPATLTLVTTAQIPGLYQNTAKLDRFEGGEQICPDGGCAYHDGDPSNDSNDAWVLIQTKPQVLGSNTLANTGSGTTASLIAAGLISITVIVAADGRLFRKRGHYKLI